MKVEALFWVFWRIRLGSSAFGFIVCRFAIGKLKTIFLGKQSFLFLNKFEKTLEKYIQARLRLYEMINEKLVLP